MSVGSVQAFRPVGTVAITASGTSATTPLPPSGDTVLIQNSGSAVAFVRLDAGPATSADMPVLINGQILLDCPTPVTAWSVIGTGVVYATRGTGTAI